MGQISCKDKLLSTNFWKQSILYQYKFTNQPLKQILVSISYPKIAQEMSSEPVVQGKYLFNKPTSKTFFNKQTNFKIDFSFWNLLFKCWTSKINKPQQFPVSFKGYTSSQSIDQFLSTNSFWLFIWNRKIDLFGFWFY